MQRYKFLKFDYSELMVSNGTLSLRAEANRNTNEWTIYREGNKTLCGMQLIIKYVARSARKTEKQFAEKEIVA